MRRDLTKEFDAPVALRCPACHRGFMTEFYDYDVEAIETLINARMSVAYGINTACPFCEHEWFCTWLAPICRPFKAGL